VVGRDLQQGQGGSERLVEDDGVGLRAHEGLEAVVQVPQCLPNEVAHQRRGGLRLPLPFSLQHCRQLAHLGVLQDQADCERDRRFELGVLGASAQLGRVAGQ